MIGRARTILDLLRLLRNGSAIFCNLAAMFGVSPTLSRPDRFRRPSDPRRPDQCERRRELATTSPAARPVLRRLLQFQGQRVPRAAHHPHALSDSQNIQGGRARETGRHDCRDGRPGRRRSFGTGASDRATLRDRAVRKAQLTRPGRRT
jgi:hypothetical protein